MHLRLVLFGLCLLPASAAADDVRQEDPKKDVSNNKGKIEDTRWSSIATEIQGNKLPAGALTIAFSGSGRVTYVAGPRTFTGTYTLKKGNTVIFEFDTAIDSRKRHEETIVIKKNRLTMTDSDGTSLTFSKVIPKPKEE